MLSPKAATSSDTDRSVGTATRKPVRNAPITEPTPAMAASSVKPAVSLSNTLAATIGSTDK
jgi:hypothetical protein